MDKMAKLDNVVKFVKAQEAVGLAKAKDIIDDVKSVEIPNISIQVPEFLKKEEVAEEKECPCKKVCLIVGIVLAILAVAGIIYGLYCYFTPDYLDDFEDDLEDEEFEDEDIFEDEKETE